MKIGLTDEDRDFYRRLYEASARHRNTSVPCACCGKVVAKGTNRNEDGHEICNRCLRSALEQE